MKVVDYRPLLVRRFSNPKRQISSPGFVARLLGKLVDEVISWRVAKRPEPAASPYLISVGNLALGGTGKTPVVMSLAHVLAGAGIQGAVLTRGYGSSLAGPLIVHPENEKAGDEARMMAEHLSELSWPIIQCRNRPRGLEFINNLPNPPKLVLLEDAHQTGGLARHLDLVILDAWNCLENHSEEAPGVCLEPITGPVFPLGSWRETAQGSRRASALLIEGADTPPSASVFGQPVFAFNRRVNLRLVQGELKDLQASKWALVSGIAKPQPFEFSAQKCLSQPVVLSVRCLDHEPYSASLIKKILREMDICQATALVTTAKDWVKLESLWNDSRPVMVLDMELLWENENALNRWLVERVYQSNA